MARSPPIWGWTDPRFPVGRSIQEVTPKPSFVLECKLFIIIILILIRHRPTLSEIASRGEVQAAGAEGAGDPVDEVGHLGPSSRGQRLPGGRLGAGEANRVKTTKEEMGSI